MSTEQQLPEKTCTIEQMVTKAEDVQNVLNGTKTTQRRNGLYAYPGEIWEVEGRKFEVYNVYAQTLGEMTDENAKTEGYQDMETYKNYILSMHPGMPWVPQMKMWVHEFREVSV